MIRLTATRTGILAVNRIGISDRFLFLMERGGAPLLSTEDPAEVVVKLLDLGVEKPLDLIRHVEVWGTVDIPDEGLAAKKFGASAKSG